MRDEQQRPGILAQPGLQPQQCVQVEVVGGLIEQQQIRAAHEGAREVGAPPQATGELAHRPREIRVRKSESVGEPRRARLRTVGALRLEPCVQQCLARALALRLRLPELCLRGAQLEVPVHDEVDERALAFGELLLDGGDSELARRLVVAGVGRVGAAQQREQRRLARAVAADDADLLAAEDADRELIEQDVRTAAHADVA